MPWFPRKFQPNASMADGAWAEAGEDFRGITDWQEAAAAAEAAGSPLAGLPRGIRVRNTARKSAKAAPDQDDTSDHALPLPSKREIGMLCMFLVASLILLGHFMYRRTGSDTTMPQSGCKQCQQKWWDDFWQWRFESVGMDPEKVQKAPEGMEWEWSVEANHTDWFGVSAEFVDSVVSTYADPSLGPLLHVGCGDSPLPELLYRAGFRASEHIDIAPQVVSTMQQRYPQTEWPGMSFEVRDFLAPADIGGGPPPPLHRFAAVVDKAGLWDWLQDEAMEHLPKLLTSVREALLAGPTKGVYIIVTKQTPVQLSETLAKARAQFLVETSQPLGKTGIAWSYVLEPL